MNIGIHWYSLDENNNVIECGMDEIRSFLDSQRKIVKHTYLGPFFISTVFLGLDMNFNMFNTPGYRPTIFETMVFTEGDGYLDRRCERCCTYTEAEAQHKMVLDELINEQGWTDMDITALTLQNKRNHF